MKTSKNLICLFLFLISLQNAHGMGAKRPSPPTTPKAPTTPQPTPSIKPTLDFGAKLDPSDYLDSSAEIGPKVDDDQNDNELSGVVREKINNDGVDKCFIDDRSHDYFSDQISYYTLLMMEDTEAYVGFIGSLYGASANDSNYFPTSLIRHPLCVVTTASLKKTINKVPSQKTITRLNNFANSINAMRQSVLDGDLKAKKALLSTWTKLFSCLAYSESLGTADSTSSKSIAQKVAPSNYRKPAGVKFYDDPAQSSESRLNIGMFQFTPTASGNIQPCLRAWNKIHANKPECLLNQKASQSELIGILGSSLQSFNAFCGVHKLIQTYAIQVNTNKSSATSPQNLINGKLKGYEERCVTPHFQAGRAYNHFGPFQNSTGSNLEELFSCIDRSL